jgi:hypothetical protein
VSCAISFKMANGLIFNRFGVEFMGLIEGKV